MNDPDPLLRQLAELAREEEQVQAALADDRWDALCAGRLSPSQAQELRSAAAATPEGRERLEAFSPVSSAFRADLHQRLHRNLVAEPASRQRARPWQPWALAASLSLAAGLSWWWWSTLQPLLAGSPLPAYAATWSGAVAVLRSEPATGSSQDPLTFEAGSTFELILRPATPTSPVEVALYRASGGGWSTLEAEVRISDEGAVRITGQVGSNLSWPLGPSTLLVAVGRPGGLPPPETLDQALAQASSVATSSWIGWKQQVLVRGPS